MDVKWMDRPARKQADRVQGQDGFDEGGSDYNIWHHKRGGVKRKERNSVASTSKCDVNADSGKTRAGKNDYFCLHFARGKCIQGSNCAFQHHIPDSEDEARVQKDNSSDCFGRDRHQEYRDDMKGAGSFNRENKSIMISGLHMDKPLDVALRTAFSEYGPVERVYIVADKAIAFVKFDGSLMTEQSDKWRSSAEFGKEAMDGQTINGYPITTKWAHEDPNPSQKQKEQVSLHRRAEEAVAKRLRSISGQEQAAISFELTGQYPNTDSQYSQYSHHQYPTDSQYPNTDSQYPNTDSQYPNTDSQYPNTDSQYPSTHTHYYSNNTPNITTTTPSLSSVPAEPKKPVVSEGLLALGNYSDSEDE